MSHSSFETAAKNLFRVQMRLGMFDPDEMQPYRQLRAESVDTPAHRALALEAARQGMVLVKNLNQTLPLTQGTTKKIAAVGPNADATTTLQSNYHGAASVIVSPAQGLKMFASVTTNKGCGIGDKSTSGISAAAKAAAEADRTVIVVGLDQSQEKEGLDRTSLVLPGKQLELIEQVSAASKEPAVLVVISGGPVDLSAAKNNPKVGAILIAGYPGQAGGQAIAETLFGINNPGGRLTQTWYAADFTSKCSMLDMNMRPNASTGCPGRGYRFFEEQPVFRFGAGLSYTTFEHSLTSSNPVIAQFSSVEIEKELEATRYRPHRAPVMATAQVQVTNTGSLGGDEVVLAMLQPPGAGKAGEPITILRRYQRLSLGPRESKTVHFGFTAHDLATFNEDGRARPLIGDWKVTTQESQSYLVIRVV